MTFSDQQYIDGAWTGAAGGGTWEVINPATEEIVRSVPFGGREDCHAAIEAAARAFPAWARRTPYERGAILQRAALRMRERGRRAWRTMMVLECGKPLAQARGEWMVGRRSVRLVRRGGQARLRAHDSVARRLEADDACSASRWAWSA